ncbi:hypothetical protein LQ327_33320 [Actinomycetospora endophytica]|uniref:Uncharacterized protein n=1 Tax=Actinomycetospora endophytica TaxID=2291215 RepID=A0ABS8PJ03_9PSEU|nr:hypothetical protein [Actinomycetospora endophytica]MCD2198257.1 hypothetical protein [Actinomycetospora endophytica]
MANADGSQLDCTTLAPIEQGMGAHSAPLGLSFTTSPLPDGWGTGALIGAHGSWDRTPVTPSSSASTTGCCSSTSRPVTSRPRRARAAVRGGRAASSPG